jgi:Cu(I)/Ag(I) efflux system membrane fusion protein/cobalt-zinc-cadmium efflux system membrane fusion protein
VVEGGQSLVASAAERLKLFGVPSQEIRRLKSTGKTRRAVEIDAPISGYVVELNAKPNMYAQPETRLFTITDLSKVWIYAAVFQNEISKVKVGADALVTVDSYPGEQFTGRVDYIWPQIDPMTRTVRVRCELANADGRLRPGMFARVLLRSELGRMLVIPQDGVLRTGTRNIVFIDRGDGFLAPSEVELGPRTGDDLVVLKGLKAGDRIVSSANFLIDSESQLQAAAGTFVPPPPGVSAAASQPGTSMPAAAVEMKTDPDPPARGRDRVRVTLRDASGKPITGANVSVTFYMAAMPAMGMAAMRAQATATDQGNGVYASDIDLQSGGTWQVTIVAAKDGQTIATKQFNVTASGPMA